MHIQPVYYESFVQHTKAHLLVLYCHRGLKWKSLRLINNITIELNKWFDSTLTESFNVVFFCQLKSDSAGFNINCKEKQVIDIFKWASINLNRVLFESLLWFGVFFQSQRKHSFSLNIARTFQHFSWITTRNLIIKPFFRFHISFTQTTHVRKLLLCRGCHTVT